MDLVPEDLRQFLARNVESVTQLEILRVLAEEQGKDWTATLLAVAVQVSPDSARAHVAALQSRGLVVAGEQGGELRCRHGAATPELTGLLDRLLRCYRERPVTMIRWVYAQDRDPAQRFADAFRLRKEEG